MKQLKFLRAWLVMLCLVLSTGVMWGEDVVYKTALFGSSYNSQSVSSYYNSWTATNDGFTVNLANWNNNNNGWSYIKAGHKNTAYVATITTAAAIDKAVTKITVTIDAITVANVNSIKLYSGESADACTTEVGSFEKSTGAKTVSISSPIANKFFKIAFDCIAKANGCVQVSKVEYYYDNAGGSTPEPTRYTVTIADNIANGRVTASPDLASEGDEVTLTATPADGYEFGAWNVTDASSNAITVTDNKFTMPASDVNVSATFNEIQGGGGDSKEYTHDVLIADDFTATSTTYKDFSNVSKNTAVYAGNSAKNNGIQLRSSNSNSGIVSTTSGGNIKKVTVIWNSNCTSGRTIDVYGNSTAYESASDLYNNSKQGTKLGSIVMGTSTSLTVNGDYAYVGVRSNSGALNIDEIDFAWEEGGNTPEPTSAYTVRFDAGSNGTCNTTELTEEAAGAGVTLPEVTSNTGWVFQGWSTSSTPTSADAGVAGATYKPSADITLYAYYTLDIPEYSGSYVDIDLSTDNTNTATESEMTWKNAVMNIVVDRNGEDNTAVNNYYPGTSGKSYTSTRFYKNTILSFTPTSGITITGIKYTSTTDEYAGAFANSTWTNGVAVADATNKIVYVTPSDGTQVISATIGATTGGTNFRIYYSGTPVLPTTYNVTIDSNIENGTVTAYPTSAAEGATVTLTATPATGYEFEAWDVKGADNSSITVTNNKFTMPAQDVTVSATFSPITYTITVKDYIENGTVSVSANEAHYGAEISIFAAPNEGYEVDEYIVTNADNSEEEVTVTNGKFTLPAYNVNVNVTFKEKAAPKPTYTVAWSVNGNVVKSENLEEGATVIAPDDPEAINGKVFTGWVTTSTVDADATPEYVTPAATATENVTYYAVFARKTGEGDVTYTKVDNYDVDPNAEYVLAANESNSINTLHYFSSYTGTTANESWGVTSTDVNDAIVFTLTTTPISGTDTDVILVAKDTKGNYLQGLATGKFRMSSDLTNLLYRKDGTIHNSEKDKSSWNLRYNHNNGSGGFRWYINTTGTEAHFYKKIGGISYSDFTTIVITSAPEFGELEFKATTGNDNYYATFSPTQNVIFDGEQDIELYTVAVDDSELVMIEVSDNSLSAVTDKTKDEGWVAGYYVQAGAAVLAYSIGNAPAKYYYTEDNDQNIVEDVEMDPGYNMLVPCTTDGIFKAEADEYYYFKLAYDNYTEKTGLGFWWGASDGSGNFKVKAGTALLRVPKGQQGSAKGYTFDSMGEANGIEAVEEIDNNDVIYNLQGVRLNSLQKGINIVNGRKVIR